MTPEVQAFATGFPVTLLHAGVTLAMLVFGAVIYSLLTPYKEVQLVREGNAAAAISLGGVVIGLAVPLAVSLSASPSVLEIAIWGLATTAVQLLVFRITDLFLAGLPARIEEGDTAAAALLTAARLASALILAAAVAG
jgi:putative membrane protein